MPAIAPAGASDSPVASPYPAAINPMVSKRTWQVPMEAPARTRRGAGRERWQRALKDKASVPIRDLPILETPAQPRRMCSSAAFTTLRWTWAGCRALWWRSPGRRRLSSETSRRLPVKNRGGKSRHGINPPNNLLPSGVFLVFSISLFTWAIAG